MPWMVLAAAFAALLFAPAAHAAMDGAGGYGPSPRLPSPTDSLIPTVRVPKAVGWPQGGTPVAAPGLAVSLFASGLNHPRWLYVLPNGDVLVAESNAPPKDAPGLKDWVMGMVKKRAGAGTESANRISLLRDNDGDGVAEMRTAFLERLNSPFGMALVGDTLYVANADAVLAFSYKRGQTTITDHGRVVADLPSRPLNHHWTKGLLASKDGKKLYVSVGSNSNVAENGMEVEGGRAAIHEIDIATGQVRLYATGLRNPVGMAWQGNTLWTVVNERDNLGNNLVPDYLTSVQDGGFYGWPYSYFGQNVDTRVTPPRPDLVAKAIVPDYALGAHTAALGLTFDETSKLPSPYKGGAFIGLHGSWNRDPPAGYKVIFVPFKNGKPSGMPVDVLTGFLVDGKALGRPVGVAFDSRGGLLVADDSGNAVWRVSGAR